MSLAVSNAARLLLLTVFAVTALAKLLDIQGFADVLRGYLLFPPPLLAPIGRTLALVELAVAIGLARRATSRPAALAALVISLGFAVVLIITLWRGIALANCGCFGVYWARPLQPWTPAEDLVLAGLALLAARRPA